MNSLNQVLLRLKLGNALRGEDASEVRKLLDEGAIALGAAGDAGGFTPLHDLAYYNQSVSSADMAQALLDYGALVNAQTSSYGSTPLYYSCMNSNVALSRRLLVNGANPNLKDNDGYSAMHRACRKGPLELALLLVRFGANVYLIDKYGQTPLDWCRIGDVNISRETVKTAFTTREENWRRRWQFVAFRACIYGSGTFQAKQEKLLPALRQASLVVQSSDEKAWESLDKVFGNPDLCRYIMQYI